MRLEQQRAEQDGAMMNVQDRTNSNSTANTPLQPRVGEMAPIGMHVMPHQREVLESGGNYIGTEIGIQRMAMEPKEFSIKELQIAHFLEKTMNNSFQKKVREINQSVLYSFSFQFPVPLSQATRMTIFLDAGTNLFYSSK